MDDLGAVLEAARSDAKVLRRAGHETEATLLEHFARDVEASARPWLHFMSESTALLRCGRKRAWLRARFSEMQRDGHAKMHGKERLYRECMVPAREAATSARLAGFMAGQKLKQAS